MIGEIVNSRYQVLRKLDEERWGGAWLAEDTLGGGALVLRVVMGDLAGADRVQHLRHAFRARAQVIHPVLAQVHDCGALVGTGNSFFTHEHVEGKDLLEGSEGWDVARVCGAAAGVLNAMACLHARGLHGLDLRPTAFRVAGGGLKWLEVGLALGEEEEEGIPIAVSPECTAPEVLRGGPIGCRSDLWAFGVLLYQLLARRHPFEGEGGRSLLARIAYDAPDAPSKHKSGISPALEAFVLGLLSKDPSARPAGANAAISDLSRLSKKAYETWPGEEAEAFPQGQAPDAEALSKGKGMLKDALGMGRAARPCFVVRGEAGSGKSRILAEMALLARLSGATVVEASCRDGTDHPLGPFQAILDALDGPKPKADEDRHEWFDSSSEAEAVFGPRSERERIRLAQSVATFLLEMARKRPLLLLVEDLQWADEAAVGLLRHVARDLSLAWEGTEGGPRPRMLLVASTRGTDGPIDTTLSESVRLSSRRGNGDTERERLARLGRTERHLLDLLAALKGSASLDLLARVSGLERDAVLDSLEILCRRGLVERRSRRGGTLYRVVRHTTREAAYAELDGKRREALHRMIAAGLDATLGQDDASRAFQLAEHFDRGAQPDRAAPLYVRAAGAARHAKNASQAAAFLARAVELSPPEWKGPFAEMFADVEAWAGRFDEAIAAFELAASDPSLAPAGRARLLRKQAQAHLDRGDVESAFQVAGLAHAKLDTITEASESASVVSVLCAALVRRGEPEAAVSGARKMLDQVSSKEAADARLDLRVTLAQAYRASGDRNHAISELEGCLHGARERLDEGASLVRVLSSLAELHEATGDAVRALQCRAEALENAGKARDLQAMWALHVGMVGSHARQGATDLANVHLKEAERLARRLGSPQALCVVFSSLGGIALDSGKPEAALAHYKKALEVSESMGVPDQRPRHLCDIGIALWRLGRFEEAERAFREGGDAGGAGEAVLRCLAKLASMYVSLGMFAEARQSALRARERAEASRVAREVARADQTLAEVALLARQAEEATLRAESAVSLFRSLRVPRRLAAALAVQAESLALAGRLEDASVAADEALRILDRVSHHVVRASCLSAKARVLLARAAAAPVERKGETLAQVLPLAREVLQLSSQAGGRRTWPAHLLLAHVRAAQMDSAPAREHATKASALCAEEAAKLPARFREAFLARPDVREASALAASLAEAVPAATLSADERARFLDLMRVTRDLTRERDTDTLLRSITDHVVRLFHADRGVLMLVEDAQLRCAVARDAEGASLSTQDLAVDEAIVGGVMKGGAPVIAPLGNATRTVACLPLSVHERVLGLLYLDVAGQPFSEADIEVMTAFASGAAIAIENAHLYSQVIVDDLTGLKSHRYFLLRLHEEVRHAKRLERPVALIHLDVDRLKLVNDIHGAEGGNAAIQGVAQTLQDLLREDDTMRVAPKRAGGEKVVARVEGGKFEVLLPDTDAAGAAVMAERILDRVRAIAFAMERAADAPRAQVTASAGVAAFPADAREAEALTLKAGEALYTAKRNGRDRVFAYAGDGPRADAEVKGKITDADFDSLALSRDQRTFMGMVSRILDCELDLEKILEVALSLVVDVTGAQRAMILLKEPGGFLRPRCSHGIPMEEMEVQRHAVSYTLVREAATKGEPILIRNTANDPDLCQQASVVELSLKSMLCAPIQFHKETIGVFYLDTAALDREFTEQDRALLMAFAHKIATPLQASRIHQWHAEETKMLRRTLDELGTKYTYDNIVGVSKPMQEMYKLLDKVTPTDYPVMIQGESGTGKELVARAIHFNGPRKGRPFVAENCAALPETLLESELFGHVRGAFTGADRDKKGLFELANGGTLFLDEVGDMGAEMQKALLRALQEGVIRPVGGKTSVKVDVRVIAATHRRLDEMVKEGKFREDLYYRLQVIPIAIPPLRERQEDIPYLVHHFLEKYAKGTPHPQRKIEKGAMEALMRHEWPGNVRELENEVKRAVAMGGEVISLGALSPAIRKGAAPGKEKSSLRIAPKMKLVDMIRDAILQSLKDHDWNVRATARDLGMDRMALVRRIEKYAIVMPRGEQDEEGGED